MKRRLIRFGEAIAEYNNVTIYRDEYSVYIYLGKHGHIKMEFQNEDEARDYIDENLN